MSRTENRVNIRGYVGNDPEYRVTSRGNTVAKFVVGTEDIIFNEVKLQWHNVVVTGEGLVEKVRSIVTKGTKISLSGRIYYHKGDIGSHERFTTDIIVDDFCSINIDEQEVHVVAPYND
jgi:single-stranded DNA-binding protein